MIHKETPVARKAKKGLLAILAGGLGVLAAVYLLALGRTATAPESPMWIASTVAQSVLGKLPLAALGLSLIAVTVKFGASFFFRLNEGKMTSLWKRDMEGKFTEDLSLRVQKTKNAGTIYAAIILGSFLFWGQMFGGR